MDDSLVDIVLILLATLVAISTISTFDVEPPLSQEAEPGAPMLQPLQVAISANGMFMTVEGGGSPAQLDPNDLYTLMVSSHPDRMVEFTADQNAPARLLLTANNIVQQAERQAVFLVLVDAPPS